MNNKEIKRYLICTFFFSWLLWGSLGLLTHYDILPFQSPISILLLMLGGIMPALCEITLKKKYSSTNEFKDFMRNILNPKHSIVLYLITIGIALLFCTLPILWDGASYISPFYIAILEIPFMIIGGGIEEIGWRGLLQPELQKKYPTFIASLLVGIIWVFWHIPLWFIDGSNQSKINFLWFFFSALALSFLLAELYTATKSIYLCILFHAVINSLWDVFAPDSKVTSAIILLFLSLLFTIVFKVLSKKQKRGILPIVP